MMVARHVVPEGLNDGSQAIYCLESVSEEIRPVESLWLLVPYSQES